MIGQFNYTRPHTIDEALEVLAGEGACPLAGGTDLLIQIRNGKRDPRVLVDLKGIAELKNVEDVGDYIRIGPLVTINQILKSELLSAYTALLNGAAVLGCHEIRNRATVGGNICNASPSGDVLIPLLLFDPLLVVRGRGGQREIPMEDFFTGAGKTILAQGEILTDILLPKVGDCKSVYRRKSRIKGMDLSSISMGLLIKPLPGGTHSFRLVFGAVTACPKRMRQAEQILSGRPLERELVDEAIKAVQNVIAPRESSLRGSPAYKRAMVEVLLRDGIKELTEGNFL